MRLLQSDGNRNVGHSFERPKIPSHPWKKQTRPMDWTPLILVSPRALLKEVATRADFKELDCEDLGFWITQWLAKQRGTARKATAL